MSQQHATKDLQQQSYYHGAAAIWKKLCYGLGDAAYNLPWMLVSAYLAIFMTDVALIPAGVVSGLFLFCRVWDAVNDPMIGALADRTRTPMGRYRPWMLGGGLLMIPTVVLMFWAHPGWSVGMRSAYGCCLYFFAVVFCTALQIPYTALNGVVSPFPKERASFSSYRAMIASLACAVATGIFTPMVKRFAGAEGNQVRGYLMAAAVECAIAVPFLLVCVFGTKEIVQPKTERQKHSLSVVLNTFLKNPPLLIVCCAYLVQGFMSYGRMTVSAFYFTYIWGSIGLFSLFATANGLVSAFSAMLTPVVIRIFGSKRTAVIFAFGANAVIHTLLFFLTPDRCAPMVSIAIRWLTGICTGLMTAMLYGFIGDAVDYGQWKTGMRADGLAASGTSLMMKLGGAVGPAALLALLAANGYVPNAAEQVPATISTLNATMNLLPAGLSVLVVILFCFYKLDDKTHAKIIAEMQERGEYKIG